MRVQEPARLMDGLAAILAGAEIDWSALDVSPETLLDTAARQDLTGLIYRGVNRLPEASGWPEALLADLARGAFGEAARELQLGAEIVRVLDALATAGLDPILLKGTPLAYAVYEAPALRPRRDTDVFIRKDQAGAVHRVMAELGYTASALCDGELLFCQFEFSRTDEFGICHAFDFHWKISTQPVFADALSFDELAASAQPLPALGGGARCAGLLHALLLACIHPVMHHRNVERLIWIFDVHLMASRFTDADFEQFGGLVLRKKMAAVVARQLALCQDTFHTAVPVRLMRQLSSARHEPSADYLRPDRRWHDELASSVRDLPAFRDRVRLLREVFFPGRAYMLRAYGLEGRHLGNLLLPALYLHRNVHGAWKIVLGRK